MKVKCIESNCDWFTQGMEYAAQQYDHRTIAIMQDDMCSDLSDNNDSWIAARNRLRGVAGDVYTIQTFHPFRELAAFTLIGE